MPMRLADGLSVPKNQFKVRYSEDAADAISLRNVRHGENQAETAQVLRLLDSDAFRGRTAPQSPTEWPPGTLQKIAIMRARAALGLNPCRRGDATLGGKSVVNARAATGDPLLNGSAPVWSQRTVNEHAHLDKEKWDESEIEAWEMAESWENMDRIARSYLAPESEEFTAELSPFSIAALAARQAKRKAVAA
jgi:hypothetical protein